LLIKPLAENIQGKTCKPRRVFFFVVVAGDLGNENDSQQAYADVK
jgi:hypothetical protein